MNDPEAMAQMEAMQKKGKKGAMQGLKEMKKQAHLYEDTSDKPEEKPVKPRSVEELKMESVMA